MNLNEEKKYQMRQEAYEEIGLTEKNKEIAEEYLDMEQEERKELLEQVEKQSFTDLTNEQRMKSVNYLEYLEKRKKEPEMDRYMRLMFAVGGSTCEKVISRWGYMFDRRGVFEEAQATAIYAEKMVWSSHMLDKHGLRVLWEPAHKDPEILREAMEYCYNPSENAKILLRAIYLNCTEPNNSKGSFLKGIFQGKDAKEDLKAQAAMMEEAFLKSLSPMFQMKLSQEEEQKLQEYVKAGDITKEVPDFLYQLGNRHIHLDYTLCFLAGTAFLVIEHTPQAAALLRLLAVLDYEAVYRICEQMAQPKWFKKQEELLERILNIAPSEYIVLNIIHEQMQAVGRMVEQYPEAAEKALKDLDADKYGCLVKVIKEKNPSLYQRVHGSSQSDYFEKVAYEVIKDYGYGRDEAKEYLLRIREVDDLRPFMENYRKTSSYGWKKAGLIKEARKQDGEEFYRRAFIFLGLTGETYAFNSLVKEKSVEAIEEMLSVFEGENLPVDLQLEVAETAYNGYYSEQSQIFFLNEIVKAYAKRKEQWGDALSLAAKESNVVGRYISIRFMAEQKETYKKEVLSCTGDTSKMIKEMLEAILMDCPEWEDDIKAMLSSKKAQEREMAILVLKRWGASKYQEEFAKALEKEKSKKVKELLSECLGVTTESETEGTEAKTDPESIVKELHKGGKKRKVQWAYETPFVPVHKKDGQEVSEEYLQALALCYADMSIPGANKQALILAQDLNEEELAAYAAELFDKWLESNAEAKKKWVLYFASIHGGAVIVPKLVHQINEWPKLARGAIAAEAVKALALNGSQTALLTVDGISRKFKFKQVKSAAGEALEYAATELGISKEELADKIVPDLGFDEECKRTFDYGERSFVVYLTPSLELEVFDDNGKKLKNVPAPGKKDDPELAKAAHESFKLMKKQMKTVITNQKQRLEMALSSERQWSVEKWKELFVKNPVMHQFAISLIWGVYNQDGLVETFRYMEDGSFNTKDEDEFEFPTDGSIGLVHPIELDSETKEQWKEQLSDYEVTQAIDQLERTVYEITEEEKEKTVLTKFAGKFMKAISLSGKLQDLGWYRGSIQDAGGYDTFYKEDAHMAVELHFSGTFIGCDFEDEITIYGVRFYKPGTVARGSYVYDTIKKENLYKLGQVSPRYFSEIVYQLEKATASSTETVEVEEDVLK